MRPQDGPKQRGPAARIPLVFFPSHAYTVRLRQIQIIVITEVNKDVPPSSPFIHFKKTRQIPDAKLEFSQGASEFQHDVLVTRMRSSCYLEAAHGRSEAISIFSVRVLLSAAKRNVASVMVPFPHQMIVGLCGSTGKRPFHEPHRNSTLTAWF
jgi:hypothetical protein